MGNDIDIRYRFHYLGQAAVGQATKANQAIRNEVGKATQYVKDQTAAAHENSAAWQKQTTIQNQAARSQQQFTATTDQNTRSLMMHRSEVDNNIHSMRDMNIQFTAFGNIIKLLKWPALISGAGLAAQAISALSGAVIGLVGALEPLSGALVAYPALISTFMQGMVTLRIAGIDKLKAAVGGLNTQLDQSTTAFKALSPEAQAFAIQLDKLKAPMKEVQATVQKGLFPGLEKAAQTIVKNGLGPLEEVFGRTARTLGFLAQKAADLLTSQGFGKRFEEIGNNNTKTMRRLGTAMLDLVDAMSHILVAARPLINWMTKGIEGFASWADKAAAAGQRTGELGGFFDQTRGTMSKLISILGNLGQGFQNVLSAAAPLGRMVLNMLDRMTGKWAEWTSSVEGKNELKHYFEELRPAVKEILRLSRDLIDMFARLGRNEGLGELLRMIRHDVLPGVEQLISTTTQAFGPKVVELAAQVLNLFTKMAGSSGPLSTLTSSLTEFLTVINSVLDKVPFLQTLVINLLALAGIEKAFKWAAALAGMKALTAMVSELRMQFKGAIAEEGALINQTAAASRTPLTGAGKMTTVQEQMLEANPPVNQVPMTRTGAGLRKTAVHVSRARGATAGAGLAAALAGATGAFGPGASATLSTISTVGIGASLLPLEKGVHGLGEWIEKSPRAQQWIVKLQGAFRQFGGILMGVVTAAVGPLIGAIGGLGPALAGARTAVIGFVTTLKGALITSGIGAAILAIIIFRKQILEGLRWVWEKIGPYVEDIGQFFVDLYKRYIRPAIDWIVGAWEDALPTIKTILGGIRNVVAIYIFPMVQYIKLQFKVLPVVFRTVFNVLKAIVKAGIWAVKEIIIPVVKTIVSNLKQFFTEGFHIIRGVVKAGVAVIKGVWWGVKNIFIEPIRWVISHIIDILRGAWGHIKGPVTAIADGIGDAFRGIVGVVRSVFGTVKDVLSGIWGTIKSIVLFVVKLLDKIPGVDLSGTIEVLSGSAPGSQTGDNLHLSAGSNAGTPSRYDIHHHLPGRARGGFVDKPMLMVGEEAPHHPEYVIATNPSYRSRNVQLLAGAARHMGLNLVGGAAAGLPGMQGISQAAAPITAPIKAGALLEQLISGVTDRVGHLPSWLSGVGGWVIDQAKGFISDHRSSPLGRAIGTGLQSLGIPNVLGFAQGGVIPATVEYGIPDDIGDPKARAGTAKRKRAPHPLAAIRNMARDAKDLGQATAKNLNDQLDSGWRDTAKSTKDLSSNLSKSWKGIRDDTANVWKGIRSDTDESSTRLKRQVTDDFSDMRKVATRSSGGFRQDVSSDIDKMADYGNRRIKSMNDDVTHGMQSMAKTGKQQGQALSNAVRASMQSTDQAVYGGMNYIGKATDQALRAFSVKPLNLKIDAPALRKQDGGPIQVPGYGDGDKVPMMLPANSFVLNRNASAAYMGFANGGMVPTLLEPGELVFGPGYDRGLETLNNNIRRFAKGGNVGGGMTSMIAEANKFEAHHFPYLWGGGHGGFGIQPVDCSGAVSDVLHAGGLLSTPMVSGALMNWGKPAHGGENLVVFANPEHTWMMMNGRAFGTSGSNPGGGAGWFPTPSSGYMAGFAKRTMDVGAGASANIKRPIVKGPAGPMRSVAQASIDRARKGASTYIQRKMPAGAWGGGQPLMDGSSGDYTASWYGPTPSTTGASGQDLRGTMSFAELSKSPGSLDFSALGGLPYHYTIGVTYKGKTIQVEKLDVGAGGPGLNGTVRAIDLWEDAARKLPGFMSAGLGVVTVSGLPGGKTQRVGARAAGPNKRQRGGPIQRFQHGGRVGGPRWGGANRFAGGGNVTGYGSPVQSVITSGFGVQPPVINVVLNNPWSGSGGFQPASPPRGSLVNLASPSVAAPIRGLQHHIAALQEGVISKQDQKEIAALRKRIQALLGFVPKVMGMQLDELQKTQGNLQAQIANLQKHGVTDRERRLINDLRRRLDIVGQAFDRQADLRKFAHEINDVATGHFDELRKRLKARIHDLRKGGITRAERTAIDSLQASLKALDDELAHRMKEVQRAITQAEARESLGSSKLQQLQLRQQIAGISDTPQAFTAQAQMIRQQIIPQQRKELRAAQKELRIALQQGNPEAIRAARQQVADKQTALLQSQADSLDLIKQASEATAENTGETADAVNNLLQMGGSLAFEYQGQQFVDVNFGSGT